MRVRPVDAPIDLPALERLFALAGECDGHPPLGEHKYLDLVQGDPERTRGLVAEGPGGEMVAYIAVGASAPAGTSVLEFALHPLHRSRSEMRALVEAALSAVRAAGGTQARVWAFQPQFVSVLEAAGFVPERELRQLRVSLPVPDRPAFPPGVEVWPFRVGRDEEAWLRVNNAAFLGHPENGAWTLEVLSDRERQPWFSADGFRMAWENDDLLGFCWTKQHGSEVGEIYVIAVAPAHQGRRLGRALVLEGLRYLAAEAGATRGMLYVDADNHRATSLYERLGFRLDHLDRSLVRSI